MTDGMNMDGGLDAGFGGGFDGERKGRGDDAGEWGEPAQPRRDHRDDDDAREPEAREERGAEASDTGSDGAGEAPAGDVGDGAEAPSEATTSDAGNAEGAAPRKRRRRGGRGRSRSKRGEKAQGAGEAPSGEGSADASDAPRHERSREDGEHEDDEAPAPKAKTEHSSFTQMLINYVPGEECRVAIVEDGKLEELHAERFASASRVGNIYVGKVMNVEASIQAAFVDFGVGENGFLHVSDLHPRYFPGEDNDTTERVGLKTPRRERPPIQAALRRGDEVIVQVLKEGVGTKGPTVTSYLSIPGRFLVMMPNMDKVGVSRKVEDEEERRKMREILDQLDLPDGFGFILRTAGMDRTKAELKRDLAYLMRLWKDMDKRLAGGGKPRLLYSESDLLVRALRDMLTNETNEVIIDNEWALNRAAKFLKIVAPRTSTRLLNYNLKAPLFHTFGIEKQIANIHAREVPLPSGGRLVIDQTEALVAIDVNSGRSRDSRNSEDNAYQTNLEAVDEICRQLRLRDMGGIVINDLIDMRSLSRRREVENRFRERLRRDRAKSTVLPISEFGILQLTRQRMRASHESVHFTDCPTCRGRGMLQKPESVMGDALRQLSAMLDLDRIARIEMVVAPRIAGELLSSKRQLLSRIERTYGKHVDVRVSEAVAVDRVTFYAYDASGSDIDVGNLPMPRRPRDLSEWVDPDASGEGEWAPNVEAESQEALKAELADEPRPDEHGVHPIEVELADEDVELEIAEGARGSSTDRGGDRGGDRSGDRGEGGGRRRRRRRGGRGRGQGGEGAAPNAAPHANAGGGSGQPRAASNDRGGERGPDRGPDRGGERVGGRGPREGRREGGGRREGRPHDDANEWGEPPIPGAPLPEALDAEVEPAAHEPQSEHDTHAPRGVEPGVGDGGEMNTAGPEGAGGDGVREDGQRKRRRRRRRGRRGRGGAGGVGGQGPLHSGAPGDAGPREGAAGDGTQDGPQGGGDGDADEGGEGADFTQDDGGEGDQPSAAEGGDGAPAGGEQGEGGPRKRRRRRRRGGRGRGQGGMNAEGQGGTGQGGPAQGAGGGAMPPPLPRPSEPRGPQPSPMPPGNPPPVVRGFGYGQPTPASAPTPAKPPRTLYSNVRRKLAPGEIKRRPGEE